MGFFDDIGKLKGVGKKLLDVASEDFSTDSEDMLHISFKCLCGYHEQWSVKSFAPSEVSAAIKAHVDGCPDAQKALR